jgi:hypothetical protein
MLERSYGRSKPNKEITVSSSYTYNPDTWPPVLAGAVAGAIAAIVAGLASLPLRSPDELLANSLTVVIVSLILGVLAGALWRKLRATNNAQKTFAWSMVGAFFAVAAAIALVDLFALSNTAKYAGPLAVIIFITLGFFVPMLSQVTAPVWIAAIPIVIALALGIGLFGQGNVASGDLSLDDIDTGTTQTTADGGGAAADTAGLADSYTVASGTATYAVEETLQGLQTTGVGSTETVSGSVVPGGAFLFEIDLGSFTSDQSRRDAKVSEWFAANPTGTFSGDSFDLPTDTEVGEVVSMSVDGTLTINSIPKASQWSVDARLEGDGSLSVQGETDIVLSEFNIPVVAAPFVTMSDGARIEVLLSLSPNA